MLGIGDNVVDKYLNDKLMYPGGNALNFAVYCRMLNCDAAYIGGFGDDVAASHGPPTCVETQAIVNRREVNATCRKRI